MGNEKIDKELATRLRMLIAAKYGTATKFAEALGATASTVSQWANGNKGISHRGLYRMKNIGVNLVWLLTGEGEMTNKNGEAA